MRGLSRRQFIYVLFLIEILFCGQRDGVFFECSLMTAVPLRVSIQFVECRHAD